MRLKLVSKLVQKLLPTLALVLGVASCVPEVAVSNPYDPELPADQQQEATLSGVVVSMALDEAPLEGVLLELTGPSNPTNNPFTTTADGVFNFGELTPGVYTLEVSHATHFRQVRDIILGAGEARELSVKLDGIPDSQTDTSGHLSGVAHKAGELNLPEEARDHSGITVEITGAGVRTTTNSVGQFDLYLNAGDYEVSLSAPDHVAQSGLAITLTAGTTTQISATPIVLAGNPGQVSGVILLEGMAVDLNDGVDVALIGGESTVSATDGTYLISGVSPGTYTLQASIADYDSETLIGVVVRGGLVSDIPTIKLRRSRGTIVGNVELQGVASTNYSGVSIGLSGTTHSTDTNAEGSFALEGVATGTYDLVASKDEFSSEVVGGITVLKDEATTLGSIILVKQQGGFQLDSGQEYSNEANGDVELSMEAPEGSVSFVLSGDLLSDAVADWCPVALYDSGSDTCDYDPTATVIVRLSVDDGRKTVNVVYKDAAGVDSPTFADTIVLDRVAPESIPGEPPLAINNGSAFTKNSSGIVTLAFAMQDPLSAVSKYRISNDGVWDTEQWRSYVASTTHSLDDSTTQGTKTVYVEFMDGAGNTTTAIAEETVVDIILDYSPPTIVSAELQCPDSSASAGYCNERSIYVNVTATDNFDPNPSGASWMALVNGATFAVEDYRVFLEQTVWSLTPVDGAKEVMIRVKDAAGNMAEIAAPLEIEVDTAAPTGLSINVSGTICDPGQECVLATATGIKTSTVLTALLQNDLVLAATDITAESNDNLHKMWISNDRDYSSFPAVGGAGVDFASSYFPWDLQDLDGTRTLWLRVSDLAGNISETSGAIVLDRAGPEPALLSVDEGSVTKSLSVTLRLQSAEATEMKIGGDITDAIKDTWVTLST
ncbi:carboxypeptidase regulatory-like domain-containing protein, partial [Myxococcota bacterium]|nr:carboxypeptidase regulatory-like domain-containing protein [Myxococcota bacterium]